MQRLSAEFRCLKVRMYISATPGCPFSFPLSSSHHRPQLVPGVSSRFRFSESGFAYLGTSIFTHRNNTESPLCRQKFTLGQFRCRNRCWAVLSCLHISVTDRHDACSNLSWNTNDETLNQVRVLLSRALAVLCKQTYCSCVGFQPVRHGIRCTILSRLCIHLDLLLSVV